MPVGTSDAGRARVAGEGRSCPSWRREASPILGNWPSAFMIRLLGVDAAPAANDLLGAVRIAGRARPPVQDPNVLAGRCFLRLCPPRGLPLSTPRRRREAARGAARALMAPSLQQSSAPWSTDEDTPGGWTFRAAACPTSPTSRTRASKVIEQRDVRGAVPARPARAECTAPCAAELQDEALSQNNPWRPTTRRDSPSDTSCTGQPATSVPVSPRIDSMPASDTASPPRARSPRCSSGSIGRSHSPLPRSSAMTPRSRHQRVSPPLASSPIILTLARSGALGQDG
jgi:hypothetical protein